MNKRITLCLLLTTLAVSSRADIRPQSIECKVSPLYGYRSDGTPGRIVTVQLKGEELKGELAVEVQAKGKKEKSLHPLNATGSAKIDILLPSSVPTNKSSEATLVFRGTDKLYKKKVQITPMRHWNVYLYNHSHVDIGYTNTHKNVEHVHKTNILEGIKLAEETKDHPEGSRYIWNPEVTWPLERLWASNPKTRSSTIEAIRKGQLGIDASYVNLNTSICTDEEMFHIFRFSREVQSASGKPADVFQQFDIPGISWGLIPVMAQQGIRYVISWPNNDRGGNARKNLDGKAFWWVGPDGKSKVLFFQPGKYANSGSMNKGGVTGRPWFGQRDPKKIPNAIRTGSSNVNFTKQLERLETSDYPFDFALLSWSLWDNNLIDADIPFSVKQWNEKYAYPKIRICNGHEVMTMIEEKYGNELPVVTGDFTEYWTDGLGTAAKQTAMNRNSKERLAQAETIWSMLADGVPAPRKEFDEAWRYILLGSEHTWCFENPEESYFQKNIFSTKCSYFHEAEKRSIDLLDESLAPVTDKSDGALGPKYGPSNGGFAVFNTHTWPQGGVIQLSAEESLMGDKVLDDKGNELLSQRLSNGELLVLVPEVPAMGSKHFRIVKGKCSLPGRCRITDTTLENDCLEVRLDRLTGNIVSLTKKGDRYNYIENGANTFSWLPANIDAPRPDTVLAVSVVEEGPLAVEMLVTSKATGCRSVTRSVRLTAGQPWVEISNVVDKLPLLDKDGIHFGFAFNIPQSVTRVDIPWGIMQVEKDQWPQANRNWLTLQHWLDVSNNTHGITWCSLDAPLFEYGSRTANISKGYGTKGNWYNKLEPSSTIYSWVMNNHWHTNFPLAQDGPVQFRYRLYPHEAFNAVEANRFGIGQAQPLIHVATNKAPDIKPLLAIDNPQVYATIVKSPGTENELIIRLRSLSDKAEQVQLSFPRKTPAQISICDIEERPGTPTDGKILMNPYGQSTLKLKF